MANDTKNQRAFLKLDSVQMSVHTFDQVGLESIGLGVTYFSAISAATRPNDQAESRR